MVKKIIKKVKKPAYLIKYHKKLTYSNENHPKNYAVYWLGH